MINFFPSFSFTDDGIAGRHLIKFSDADFKDIGISKGDRMDILAVLKTSKENVSSMSLPHKLTLLLSVSGI